jgi:hemerythrin-like domain-containing protein
MEKNDNSILDLMLIHHGLLEVLFKSLKDNINLETKAEFVRKIVSEFRWEMEKHFFVEEKVIFAFCTATDPQSCAIVVELLNEHKRMRDMLEELKQENVKKDSVLNRFENLLKDHRLTEEYKLYPRIDEELSEDDKSLITGRINELPKVKSLLTGK